MQEQSKDNSGDKVYLHKKDLPSLFKIKPEKPKQGKLNMEEPTVQYVETSKDLDEFVLDDHGHLIVKHDLFNHDGYTQDGIAEAFAQFAKKEKLSFF
jgi:type I restriction enzyme M protein